MSKRNQSLNGYRGSESLISKELRTPCEICGAKKKPGEMLPEASAMVGREVFAPPYCPVCVGEDIGGEKEKGNHKYANSKIKTMVHTIVDYLQRTCNAFEYIKKDLIKKIEIQNAQKGYAHIELPKEIVEDRKKFEEILAFLETENIKYGGNMLIITYIDIYYDCSYGKTKFMLYGTGSAKYIQQNNWQKSYSSGKNRSEFCVSDEQEKQIRLESIDAFVHNKDFVQEKSMLFYNTIEKLRKDHKGNEKIWKHIEDRIVHLTGNTVHNIWNHTYIQKLIDYCTNGNVELLEIDVYKIGPNNEDGTYTETYLMAKTDDFLFDQKKKEKILNQGYEISIGGPSHTQWSGEKYVLKDIISIGNPQKVRE